MWSIFWILRESIASCLSWLQWVLPFQSLCFILKLHRSYWIVHFYTSVIIKSVRHLKSSKYTHSSPSNRRQIHLQVKNEVLKYFLVRINVRLYPSQSQSLNLFMHIDFVCTLKSQKHYNRFHDLVLFLLCVLFCWFENGGGFFLRAWNALHFSSHRSDKKMADTANTIWFIELFAVWIDILQSDILSVVLGLLNAWINGRQFCNAIAVHLTCDRKKSCYFHLKRTPTPELAIFIPTHNFLSLESFLYSK